MDDDETIRQKIENIKTISDLEHKLEMEKRLQRAESERDQARGTVKSAQR
jgi:hypothetical protein